MTENKEQVLNRPAVPALIRLVQDIYHTLGWSFGSSESKAVECYCNKLMECFCLAKEPGTFEPWPVDVIDIKINLLKGDVFSPECLAPEKFENVPEHLRKRQGFGVARVQCLSVLEVVEKEPRLILIGKSGAGKTTFLKFMANRALQGEINSLELIPIFVNLSEWGQSDLLDLMVRSMVASGLPENNAGKFLECLLEQGKALVLLDDMDRAISGSGFSYIQEQISGLANQYNKNRFVVTRRIAFSNTGNHFQQFANAELVDFDQEQIAQFFRYWFRENVQLAQHWLEELKKQRQTLVRELTSTPLLLTLLCRVLETKSPKIPGSRAELFQKWFEALLKGWDEEVIARKKEPYRKLSFEQKLEILSRIAYVFFEKNQYLFHQSELESSIDDPKDRKYLLESGDNTCSAEVAGVIKAAKKHQDLLLERDQSNCCFSHLSLQEYLTAWYVKEKIVKNIPFHPSEPELAPKLPEKLSLAAKIFPWKKHIKKKSEQAEVFITKAPLGELVAHLTQQRWRKIFLLTLDLLPPEQADNLLVLMKERADNLVARNGKLQRLLSWARDKAGIIQTSHRPVSVRAFYLALDRAIARAFTRAFINSRALDPVPAFDPTFEQVLDFTLGFDSKPSSGQHALALDLALDLALTVDLNYNLADIFVFHLPNLGFSSNHAQNLGLSTLAKELEGLKIKKPKDADNEKEWAAWEDKLKHVMIWYRNLGHNFGLRRKDNQQLKTYLYANKLIASCLSNSTKVSEEIRGKILDSLLLPTKNT